MTTQAQRAGSLDACGPLAAASQLHASTDWAVLGHANPFEFDLAGTLVLLLHDDPATRTRALQDLDSAVHHANTIYPSTRPVALYIAALLSDPRSEQIGVLDRNECARLLRAVLLDWLGEMAFDVGEESLRQPGASVSPSPPRKRHWALHARYSCARPQRSPVTTTLISGTPL
jgi:hypothetical protein